MINTPRNVNTACNSRVEEISTALCGSVDETINVDETSVHTKVDKTCVHETSVDETTGTIFSDGSMEALTMRTATLPPRRS